jgi:hypothetical protein
VRPTVRGALVLAVAATLAACGESDRGEAPSGAAAGGVEAEAPGAEAISFGSALAQINGHHAVALELYAAGDERGAAVHAGHPVVEILHLVEHELAEHDEALAGELEGALEHALTAVEDGAPTAVVKTAFEHVAHLGGLAEESVVGADARASAYRGSVVAALLATAAHEYEEAVAGGRIRLDVEYQDAYGFVGEAGRLYEEVAPDVEAASAEEAEEVEEAFDVLADALPGLEPPANLVDAAEVEAAAELIGHELEETVDAQPVEESDPDEVVAEIEELLTEIEEAYADGDAEAAAELSAEAYLENYEVIEADVIELAPEVNEELEPLLGAELRRQIQTGAPQDDIEAMIDRARELLSEAHEALEAGQ